MNKAMQKVFHSMHGSKAGRDGNPVPPEPQPGASAASIAALEKKLRHRLPESVRGFLLRNNGIRDMMGSFSLLGTAELAGATAEAARAVKARFGRPLPPGLVLGFNPFSLATVQLDGNTRKKTAHEQPVVFAAPGLGLVARYETFDAFLEAAEASQARPVSRTLTAQQRKRLESSLERSVNILKFKREKDVPSGASKAGGAPDWPASNPWPKCGKCTRPLAFFYQLMTRDFPAMKVDGDRLALFVFICPGFECGAQGSPVSQRSTQVFWERVLVRAPKAVPPAPWWSDEDTPWVTVPRPSRVLLGRKGTERVPFSDVTPADLAAFAREAQLPLAHLKEAVEALSEEQQGAPPGRHHPARATKVGGVPHWEQNQSVVTCRACKQPTVPVLQMAHPEMTTGQVYVFSCATCASHPVQLIHDLD